MSQMPDKIWLHKDTKYNTGDIVCGYQYEFAQEIDDEGGIENFVEYVPIDTFIDKACEWWENELTYPSMTHEEIDYYQSKIVAFRKAMEE